MKNKLEKTTTGGADRASGEDTEAIAEDLGGKTGIGEGGVTEADEPVTTDTTDEGTALSDDQEREWHREAEKME